MFVFGTPAKIKTERISPNPDNLVRLTLYEHRPGFRKRYFVAISLYGERGWSKDVHVQSPADFDVLVEVIRSAYLNGADKALRVEGY